MRRLRFKSGLTCRSATWRRRENQKGNDMARQTTIPLLFPEEFNSNAAYLLQAAEALVFEECCSNGCVHRKNGEFLGTDVRNPTHCRHFKVSADAPIECSAFEADYGDAA